MTFPPIRNEVSQIMRLRHMRCRINVFDPPSISCPSRNYIVSQQSQFSLFPSTE
jgi:hypothetical protein